MAGEKTERAELQKAIDELPTYITGAPENVSDQTIEALRAVSKYKVSLELPERDLRQAISGLTRNIRIEQ